MVDIAAYLRLNANQFSSETAKAFAEMERLSNDTASRTRRAFENSFAEVQRLAQKALSTPLKSGALNLDAESVRAASAAASAEAAAIGQIAAAAARAAQDTGDLSENTRLYIQAAKAAEIEARQRAASLSSEAASLERLQQELMATAGAERQLTTAQGRSTISVGQKRAAMQQLGFQINDVTASLVSGINPVVIFGQQIGQVASAATGFGGRLGAVATFLGGPWGAALTGAVTVVGLLSSNLLKSGADAEKASGGLTVYANAAEMVADRIKKANDAIAGFQSSGQRRANEIGAQQQAILVTEGEINRLRERGESTAGGRAGQIIREQARRDLANAESRLATLQIQLSQIVRNDAGIRNDEADREAERAAADVKRDSAAAQRDLNKQAREAAAAQRELAADLTTIIGRFDPARKAALDYADTLKTIADLEKAGSLSGEEARRYRTEAYFSEADRVAKAQAEAMKKSIEAFGLPDIAAETEKDINRIGAAAERQMEAQAEAAKRAAEESRRIWEDQFYDLADFYEDAMTGGSGSIWDDFKRRGKRELALLAAQWTMSLLTGQQQALGGLGSLLGGGSNPLGSLMGAVPGGSGGGLLGSIGKLLGIGGKSASGLTAPTLDYDMGGLLGDGNVTSGILPGDQPIGGLATGFEGIGSQIGGAMIGNIVGSAATGLFGIKGSSTGSMLGSAAGSFLPVPGGPIVGSIIGSVLGNIVGGLFGGKKPFSTATVTGFNSLGIDANSDDGRSNAGSMGGAVQSGLQSIADALGGETGAFNVSIGTYKDHYRVNTNGYAGALNYDGQSAQGLYNFEDAESAIRFAIGDAIADGAIQGISDAAKRILQSGQDLDAAIEKAAMIEAIPDLLKQRLDPAGAALDDLMERWDPLIAALKEGGASAEQMAQAQQLYKFELEDTMDSIAGSASLKAYQASLAAGGNSPLSLRSQMATAEAALNPFLTDINAGKAVDQEKYIAAAQQYLDLNRQINGSTGAFFEGFDKVQAATGKAIERIDNAVPISRDPFAERTASAATATAEILSQQSQQLADIQASLSQIAANTNVAGGFVGGARGF